MQSERNELNELWVHLSRPNCVHKSVQREGTGDSVQFVYFVLAFSCVCLSAKNRENVLANDGNLSESSGASKPERRHAAATDRTKQQTTTNVKTAAAAKKRHKRPASAAKPPEQGLKLRIEISSTFGNIQFKTKPE